MRAQRTDGRTCKTCGEWKPAEAFYRYRTGRLHTNCYPCHNEQSKTFYAENPRAKRDYDLRRKYGIGVDEYDCLYEQQGGVCGLCGKEETARHRNTLFSLAVDHDHSTGQVRGLLCSRCNRVLGQIEDLGLECVRRYLDAHQSTRLGSHNSV